MPALTVGLDRGTGRVGIEPSHVEAGAGGGGVGAASSGSAGRVGEEEELADEAAGAESAGVV
jgi:hypothetical protein